MTAVTDRPPLDPVDPSTRHAHLGSDTGPATPTVAAGAGPVGVLDVVVVVVVALVVALPAWIWGRIFADSGHLAPIGIACAGGAGVALLSARQAWSRALSFVVLLAALLVGLGARYATNVADLPSDLVDSWKALASTGLLIPTDARFLVPPVVVSALAAWAAATVVLRRRAVVLAAIPMVAATVIALAYTVALGSLPAWYVALVVAAIGFVLVVDGTRRPGGAGFDEGTAHRVSPFELVVAGLPVVALGLVAGGLTTVVGSVGDEPFDLRERLVRPLDIFEAATPLANVKAGLVADAPEAAFTIEVSGLTGDTEIRLLPVATLDVYDGSVWSTSASFEPAGSRLPAPEQTTPVTGELVTQDIELEAAYPFRFLPRAGVVERLGGGELAWDPRSGTVAAVDAGLGGYSADVALVAPRPDVLPDPGDVPASLRSAAVVPDLTDAQFEILADYVNTVAAGGATVQDQLALIEADLRSERFGYNENAAAGHSLAALTSYLAPAPPDGVVGEGEVAARVGFSEQSASVFAVLARQLGLASRVVVGYQLDVPLTAEASQQTVTEDRIHAWPEVWIEGTGWVAFDPTNRANTTDDPSARTPAVSSGGQDAAQQDLPDPQEPILLPPEPTVGARSPLWWLLIVPLLPLLYLLMVWTAKVFRRTRRRRVTDANRRVIGAWHEVRDRLGELELPTGRSRSALDLAEHLDVIDLRDVSDPVYELAPIVDEALYAPTATSDERADQAWSLSKRAVSIARRSATPRQRLTAVLDPRPLFRR